MIPQANIIGELKSGKVYPVYMLLGEDIGAKEEFIRQLQDTLFKAEDEKRVNTTVFHGDVAGAEDVVENLTTFSFFHDNKLTIVRDFEKLKNVKLLLECLQSPNPDSKLVLLSSMKSTSSTISKSVNKHGRMSIFWPMFQNEGEQWVLSKLKEHGIQAGTDVLQFIVELSGTSRNELYSQVECIINYLSDNEVLTLEKTKKIIADLYNFTVFDLCNAILVKKSREILKIFRYLINNGEDLVKISFFCNRELRKILDAYSLKILGYDFNQIIRTLGFRKREADRIRMIIKKITMETFRNFYSSAAHLDYIIKSTPRDLSIVSFEKFLIALGKA
jgi:DNA polymerase III delta subunit